MHNTKCFTKLSTKLILPMCLNDELVQAIQGIRMGLVESHEYGNQMGKKDGECGGQFVGHMIMMM